MYMNNDFTIPVLNQNTGIQELSLDEIMMVDGAADWWGVVEGAVTAAAGVGLVAAGAAATGGTGGLAVGAGYVAALAGGVAIVAGGAQIIESLGKD